MFNFKDKMFNILFEATLPDGFEFTPEQKEKAYEIARKYYPQIKERFLKAIEDYDMDSEMMKDISLDQDNSEYFESVRKEILGDLSADNNMMISEWLSDIIDEDDFSLIDTILYNDSAGKNISLSYLVYEVLMDMLDQNV